MGYRYLFAFQKTDLMVYISHLDLQRLFRRTIKSSGYKIIYSQGFNPHPKMSIAQPLSLGYEGLEEYLEIELDTNLDTALIKDNINNHLPDGLDVTMVKKLSADTKSLASLTTLASYSVDFSEANVSFSEDDVNKFISQENILGTRRHKKTKKMIEVQIKEKIKSMHLENEILKFTIDCGSKSNLNPETLLRSFLIFCGYVDFEHIIKKCHITREKIFFQKDIIKREP